MTTPNRAVLWDMDGVLVDTKELHYQTWAQALAGLDIPFNREIFATVFGVSNARTMEMLTGQSPAPASVAGVPDHKERLFREALPGGVQPLPGVLGWLERLGAAGVPQAIASSAPQANIDALVDELGLRPHFAAMVAGEHMPPKPDPAVYLEAARRLGVPPARCVVIEDAPAGVEGARRAGMRCLAVATTRPPEALQAADLVVERLDALPEDTFERLFAAPSP